MKKRASLILALLMYGIACFGQVYHLHFGWDIRPNRIQSWLLRTNLRWFPDLKLDVEGQGDISFNNIEFNFIQLIIYPNRFF